METENKKRGGVLRWFAVLMAIFIAAGTVFGMTQMGGDSRVYADEGTWIYVDGANGNDSNDGNSAASAVKSWEKAKELLGCAEGGIYVVGTVEANGTIDTKQPDYQVVKRTSDIVMFHVAGGSKAEFININVDGEDKEFDSEVIHPDNGATINFFEGAKFQRVGYLEDVEGNRWFPEGMADDQSNNKRPYSTKGGRVCSLQKNVTINIDGAEFVNNKGKGIFWTPWDGPYGGGYANVTLTMWKGTVTGNWGHFYFNENETQSNKVQVYNALVTGNNTTYSSQRYDRPIATSAVHVCNAGTIIVRNVDGAAIFGNSQHDIEQESGGWNPGGNLQIRGNNAGEQPGKAYNKMLGGGSPNWSDLIEWDDPQTVYSPDIEAYEAHPSDEDIAKAREAAESIFENNKSVVFDSNGSIQFGRYEKEAKTTPPDTPTVDQTCDNEPTPEPETVDIKVTKEWKNADGTGAATTLPSNARFQLYADGKAVDKQVATITKDQGWTVTFKDQPKYQADGTTEIEYTVDEVSYEPVDSFDKGECTGDAATGFTWTNREKPVEEGAEGKADIVLTKKVTNGNIADYTFKFKIEAESATDAEGNAIKDIPLPAETEVANDAEGKIKFDTITYTKPGTYRYKVTEVIPDKKIDKMHYDTNAKFVTVRVTKAAQ